MADNNMARRVSFLTGLDGKIAHVTDTPSADTHLTEMKEAVGKLQQTLIADSPQLQIAFSQQPQQAAQSSKATGSRLLRLTDLQPPSAQDHLQPPQHQQPSTKASVKPLVSEIEGSFRS